MPCYLLFWGLWALRRILDIHAFLAWFDISFECTHKHVRFSTGPHARYTHWKYVAILVYHTRCGDLTGGSCQRQTVFYTPSTITISEGQKIQGRLSCAPNTKNNRDLDITISYETDSAPHTVVEYKMCVVFPFIGATQPRLVNSADRWSGLDCIFTFVFSYLIALGRQFHVAFARLPPGGLCISWLGAADIQVLINSSTSCTSLEYHVVDVVRRNPSVSVSVASAGAGRVGLRFGGLPEFGIARHDTGIPPELCLGRCCCGDA